MVWLIIPLVLLLMISPALWLRPSPRDRRVARLREAVIKAGVKVRLAAPPLHDAPRTMPGYHWYYPSQYPGPRFVLVRDEETGDALKPFYAGWRWRIEPLRRLPGGVAARLEALLERLPEDALVVESNRESLILWWQESRAEEGFAPYLEDFEYLRRHLAGRPDEPAPRQLGFGGKRREAPED